MLRDLSNLHKFINEYSRKKYTYEPLPVGSIESQVAWIFRECTAPWLKVAFDAPFAEMLQEARSLRDQFVPHRENDSQGWRSLCIHGISPIHTDCWQSYGYSSEAQVVYNWTDIAPFAPVTVNFFQNTFPYLNYQRLRFMLVEPGGYIMPHRDATENHLTTAVNISLNNPDGCQLVSELGTVPYSDLGSIFLFNNYYRHAVFNDSDQDRYHIIVHGQWNAPVWTKLIFESYLRACHG